VTAGLGNMGTCRYHLPEALRRVLAAQRFVEPTPIQMQAIPVFMQVRSSEMRRQGEGREKGGPLGLKLSLLMCQCWDDPQGTAESALTQMCTGTPL